MGKQLFIATAMEARNQTLDSTFFNTNWGVGGSCVISSSLPTITVDFATDITNGTIPFQIMVKKASYASTKAVVTTPVLTLNELVSYKKVVYAAGTAQVTNVTITKPGTPLAGDAYRVTIVDTTPGTANVDKWSFEYIDSTGSKTVANIVDGLVALINANTTINVTADNNSNVLRLTGDTKFNHFRVAGECEGTISIVYTTSLVPAVNTGTQIKALEKEFMSHGEGITNKILYPVKDYTYDAVTSTNYDLGIFKFSLKNPAKHGMTSSDFEDYTLYIAETAGSATLIDLIISAANTLYDQGA